MFSGETCTNEPTTINIPATAQAYVAPKKDPSVPKNGIAIQSKFGSREMCPRCSKGN